MKFRNLAALSLLLCLTVTAVWIASYSIQPEYEVGHTANDLRYVKFESGELRLTHYRLQSLQSGGEPAFVSGVPFAVPIWPAWLFLAIPPLGWIVPRMSSRQERPRNIPCHACGSDDMRAMPEQCPECGRIAA